MTYASIRVRTSSALVFAAVAACASDSVSTDISRPDTDGGVDVLPDSGTSAVEDASADEDAPRRSSCSPAGWCETSLPDQNLTFRSIWPLEGRAFATAESPTLGVKILEWEDAEGRWTYIDDGSQNQTGLARYVSNIWAANENEIYYAVAKGTIIHGTRPSPAEPWSWTSSTLEDHSPTHVLHAYSHDYPPEVVSGTSYPTLGVWGTTDGDVYAWYTNTIYHLVSEGAGAPSWIAEYTADDAISDEALINAEELFALGAAGTHRDDLWFSFVRTSVNRLFQSSCPVIVRKTSSGYQRIFDGILGSSRCQGPRAGLLMLSTERGWPTELRELGEGQVAGLVGGRQLVRITAEGASYSVATSMVMSLKKHSLAASNEAPYFTSLYSAPDRMWMGGTGMPGMGIVVSNADVWNAASPYQPSTLSLTGAPLEGTMYQLRGTSNTNLWLVGARHALHKTSL